MNAERLDSLAGGALEILWRSSWQAAALALIVLAVQWSLGGKVSARWRYNLWFLVLLRLLVPVTPQSPLSLFNLSNHLPRGAHAPLDPRLSRRPRPPRPAPLPPSRTRFRAACGF